MKLKDNNGDLIGSQTVVVDTGGNWLTTFPNVIIDHDPYAVDINQRVSSHNVSTPTGFNFRTYFSPAIHGHHFWSRPLTPETVEGHAASKVMDSMLRGDTTPIPMGWNDFYGYEYLSSSSTPAQYAS